MDARTTYETNHAAAKSLRRAEPASTWSWNALANVGRRATSQSPERWVCPALIVLIFLPTLTGTERLAFRDVSHFYTPLYQYVAQRCDQQWIPLWNPVCQTGIPLIGETTTAVLYPPRYVIGKFATDPATGIAWYVVFHLILASFSARWAAGRTGCGRAGRFIAGVLYPLSGSVFFLYCNPPFLVSAAWLPIAIGYLVRITSVRIASTPHKTNNARSVRSGTVAGISLAMMILAGDPQTALHCVLVATAFAIIHSLKLRVPDKSAFARLGIACLLAAGLAVPQIAASWSWSQQSSRMVQKEPSSGSRKTEAMLFSVPPWQVASLATPSPFGSMIPINRRISSLIPGDGQMWTASLYMGLISAIMILDKLLRRQQDRFDPWAVIAGAAMILAMGHFGLVWWIQWLGLAIGLPLAPQTDSSCLGGYWFLYEFLPGYDAFRYPAKWLPFVSLGIAISTASWMERGQLANATRSFMTIALLLGSGFGLTQAASNADSDHLSDFYWGPLDLAGGINEVHSSICLSAVLLTVLWLLSRHKDTSSELAAYFQTERYRLVLLSVVSTIVTCDLAYASSKLVYSVNQADERQLVTQLEKDQGKPPGSVAGRTLRMKNASGWPRIWSDTNSEQRLLEVESSGRASGYGRWHMEKHQPTLNNFVTIRGEHHARFWQAISHIADHQKSTIRWKPIQRWLSIDRVQTQGETNHPISIDETTFELLHWSEKQLDAASGLLQVDTKWTSFESGDLEVDGMTRRLKEILIDHRSPPWVLHDGDATLNSTAANRNHAGTETPKRSIARLRLNEPERLIASIESDARMLVSRPVQQDGHWQARYRRADVDDADWKEAKVLSVDHLKQGVILPPGNHILEFSYQPTWLVPALTICVATWSYVAIFFATQLLRRRQGLVSVQTLAD